MIDSPCNSVCKIATTTGFCEGCARTIDEIIAWGQMPDENKAQIVAQLASRKAAMNITEYK